MRAGGADGSDSGVKAILKDIHNKIRALENELTETHKKMAADPDKGIGRSLDRHGSYTHRGGEEDTRAWMELIGKHKE
jgi:hypothetical protein